MIDPHLGRYGAILAAASAIVALLGSAPFTPALHLIGAFLPAAATLAYHGAVISDLLTLALCLIAIAVSSLELQQFVTELPVSFAWVALCSMAVIVCAARGMRQRLRAR